MTFTANWFDRHIPTFQKHLGLLMAQDSPPVQALEIGSFEGKSSCWLMDNVLTKPDDHLFCCDTFAGSPEHDPMKVDYSGIFDRFMENVKPYGNRVTVLKGKSQDMVRELPLNFFDFVYIDGSHEAPDVLQDACISWGSLKVGGIMAFDDYFWSFWSDRMHDRPDSPDPDDLLKEPRIAIDAFLSIFRGRYTALELRDQVWIRKEIK